MSLLQPILAITLAFVPAFLWLVLWYKKDKKDPEPKRMIFRAFFLGMLATLPFFALRWQLLYSPNITAFWDVFSSSFFIPSLLLFALFSAFAEEALKHFAVLRLGKSLHIHFNQVIDGIIYSVAAALGFAFAENIAYFFYLLSLYDLNNPALWHIVGFRSFATTLGHALFSGIFGLFWGHAFCSPSVTPNHSYSTSHFFKRIFWTLRFHIIFSHILKGRPSKHGHEKGDLVREGLLLATLIHTLFNLLLSFEIGGKSLTFLIVPLFVGIFIFLAKQFLIPKNVEIFKSIEKE